MCECVCVSLCVCARALVGVTLILYTFNLSYGVLFNNHPLLRLEVNENLEEEEEKNERMKWEKI